MQVITAKNLKVPKPSWEWVEKLRASLAAFAGPDDPLTACLWAEGWPGREAVHCMYSVGLDTIRDLRNLDAIVMPHAWRFLAGGHKTTNMAAGCWATYEHPGLAAKVKATLRGPEMAALLESSEQLNYLGEVCHHPNCEYELRILRVPALYLEAFWLKSLSAGGSDLVVPYGLILDADGKVKLGASGRLDRARAYPEAEFLKIVGDAARLRLAAADHALHPKVTPASPI